VADQDRTEQALVQEVAALRQRVAELEHAEEERQQLLQETRDINERLFMASIRERDLAAQADAARARLRALIDAIPDEVWLTDEDGNVQFLNETAARWLGIEQTEDLKVPASELVALLQVMTTDGKLRPPEQAPLLRSLRGEALAGLEERVRHPPYTGPWRYRQVSSVPVRDSRGRIVGAVSVARDITDLKETEHKLQSLNETLEQRVEERTVQLRALAAELSRAEERERKRLARVLHDHLQQLLVAARLNVNALGHRLIDPSLHELAERTDGVLGEAIGTSRSLTAELSPPMLYDAGLTAALHWLVRWFEERYGLLVDVEAEELGNTTPETTRSVLFQAARELLFNVVKHAGVNRARIELRRLPDDELELVVSDQGAGFSPTQIGPTEEGGFGLFHLTERLVLLGGRLEVQSAPGQGTRIRVQAPQRQTDAQETAAADKVAGEIIRRESAPSREQAAAGERIAAAKRKAAGKPPVRVLLVDDHTIVRQGLAHLLAYEAGIQLVGQASNGQEALELARATRPDVVLMDVSMPGMDGIEATRRLVEELPGVKVIGLSMYTDPEVSQRIREAGAVDHIPKSGEPAALIEAVLQSSRHE